MPRSRYGTKRVRDLPSNQTADRNPDEIDLSEQVLANTASINFNYSQTISRETATNTGFVATAQVEELKRQLRVLEDKLRLENLSTSALLQVEELKRRLKLLEDKFAHITLVAMNNGRGDELSQFKNVRATTVHKALLSKSSSYAVVPGEASVYIGNASGGAVTFTLPAVATCIGLVLTFKKQDSSGNAVIVDGNASEAIDGATTKSLGTQFHSITIISNGTGWSIIGELD